MDNLVKAEILDVIATHYGFVAFFKANEKIFVIYLDKSRGANLKSALFKYESERPLTYEFISHLLNGFDAQVKSVVIYHEVKGTFYSHINLEMNNELGMKIIEVDGRPSDTLAVALYADAPIFIRESILKHLPDMRDTYNEIKGS